MIKATLFILFVCVSRRSVVCGSVFYLYSFSIFWATFGVWMCVLLISFSCFLGGGKKVVQRIVEVVADYDYHVNLSASSAPAT